MTDLFTDLFLEVAVKGVLSSRAQRSLVPRCDTVDGVLLKVKGTLLCEEEDGMYGM